MHELRVSYPASVLASQLAELRYHWLLRQVHKRKSHSSSIIASQLNMEYFTTCHKQDLEIFFYFFHLSPVRLTLRAILKMAILYFCWQTMMLRTSLIHPNLNNSKIPFSFVCNPFVERSSLLIEFSSVQHPFYSDYCAY